MQNKLNQQPEFFHNLFFTAVTSLGESVFLFWESSIVCTYLILVFLVLVSLYISIF